MTQHVKYLLVGAGITGLTIANELLSSGVAKDEILVVEANDYIGGLIKTDTIDGYVTEWGPEGLRGNSEQTKRIFELIETDGIPVSEESKLRYIGKGDKLVKVPTGPLSAITTGLLPFTGKIRVLKEPFVKANPEDETVAEFVRRRLGKHVVPLVDAFVTGVYGGDPHQLSIKHAFPALKNLEKEFGSLVKGGLKSARKKKAEKKESGVVEDKPKEKPPFLLTTKSGMQGIVDQLSEHVNLQLGVTVNKVSLQDGQTEIDTSNGTYSCDYLVLATGVNAVQNIELEADIKIEKLPEVEEAKVTVVTLGFEEDSFEQEVKGYGFLIPDSEERFIMGTLFSSRLFSFRAPDDKIMLRCFVGGYRHPDRITMDKDSIIKNILADLDDYLGVYKEPVFTHFQSHAPRGIPQLQLNHSAVVDWRENMEDNYPQLKFAGIGWSAIACDALIKEAREISYDLVNRN